jgi:hypothetical protein
MDPRGESPIYHIRVKGQLDQRWADWFDGLVMTSRENGDTLLSGPLVDQAALHGVLNRLHSLGLTLKLVLRTDCPCTAARCPHRAQCYECAAHHLPYCFRARTRWDRQCTTSEA